MTDAIAHITVGVADLEASLELWCGTFGMEVVARRDGADAALSALWKLPANSVERQALIRSPGIDAGWLHFVQFANPDAPVRAGADPMDLGPKNLDVYCDDIHARVAGLQSQGWTFRSRIVDYNVAGIEASEVQMPGPDDTNIVFVQVAGQTMPVSRAGYCGISTFVVIVSDMEAEIAFYRNLLGFDELLRHRISGAEIEEVINLPSSVGVEMAVLGREHQRFGRVELIRYDGPPGVDRFLRAHAPALGALHCAFRVDSVEQVCRRVAGSARRVDVDGSLFGGKSAAVLYSPAGLRVEVFEAC
jgi:catechol 2,3-dioxygenase-like lactoylglutathione lyase family enzyme